uniref:Uncharacterized protein n=1 Tax=Noccaea caerulescens TaxID=107243 RepID=A0A1J3I5C6_NOCCA
MITDPKTWNESISYFEDEEHDPQVAHMVSLIAEDFPFEHNSWRAGVKASEVGHKNVTDDDVDDTDVEVAGDINDVGESCSNVRRIQKLTLKSYETRGVVGGTSEMKVGGIEEVDVSAMLKELADGYEERTAQLLKGVYGSLEVHLDTVFDKLKAHTEALLKKEIRSIYDAH